jgi:hypothetical protein
VPRQMALGKPNGWVCWQAGAMLSARKYSDFGHQGALFPSLSFCPTGNLLGR